MRLYIKIGVPKWSEARRWGDFHFANAMKRALEKEGHTVLVQILPEWDGIEDKDSDITIHLMGLSPYRTKKGPLNVLWLISHPEIMRRLDLKQYDLILVASHPFASVVQARVSRPVFTLLQFADTHWMYPDPREDKASPLLFVGNSRKVYRKILKDLLPSHYDVHVWGERWDGLIPKSLVRGVYYPYEQVRELYSSCAILLNDHWEDMRNRGIVSNRIFDALACKAFILSDHMDEIAALFGNAVETYRTAEELHRKIEFYMEHPELRRIKAEAGYRIVAENHTAEKRMGQLQTILADPSACLSMPDMAPHQERSHGVFRPFFFKETDGSEHHD